MPMYDFKCALCGNVAENVHLQITHESKDRPLCCHEPMAYHITSVPMVHWVDPVIQPFRSIATKDRPVITTTKQNREYMKRNGLVDANEVVGKPPTKAEQMEHHAKVVASIEAVTPSKEQSAMLRERGLLDTV